MMILGVGLVGWIAVILLAIQFARAAAKSRPTPPATAALTDVHNPGMDLYERYLAAGGARAGQPGSAYSQLIPIDETAQRNARLYRDVWPDNFVPESQWPSLGEEKP